VLGFPAGPTVTHLLLRDLCAQGPFVAYVFGTMALGDVRCVIAFGVLSTLALSDLGGGAPMFRRQSRPASPTKAYPLGSGCASRW
jgi:hypothetical protein